MEYKDIELGVRLEVIAKAQQLLEGLFGMAPHLRDQLGSIDMELQDILDGFCEQHGHTPVDVMNVEEQADMSEVIETFHMCDVCGLNLASQPEQPTD